ncbi:hypothetical protein COW46_03705 [Candidatus Gracilibacteria bacterium CG17_big_fil_post_rev_8_21_14_2_50_48_13]|nr:MAG: hypothetical protein COW46_03705 [Candidatus Gracilibacteria bacterium CG17_big_fil_post_rev_8_21_14_2_50_48_13]
MDSHQYVQRYTLIVLLFLGIAGTIAAVAYALMQRVVAVDLPSLVDTAVLRQDLTVCSGGKDEPSKKGCYEQAYPVVAKLDTCTRIPYTDVSETCRAYFANIDQLRTRAEGLRQKFTYESVQLELTMKDGTKKRVTALVADDDAKRVQGLSYVPAMGANEGMLFVFPDVMKDMAFHMKDMLMPLDIIYLTKDWVPVQSFRNAVSCAGSPAEPCPLLLRRGNDVQYVLEIAPQGKEVLGVQLLDSKEIPAGS